MSVYMLGMILPSMCVMNLPVDELEGIWIDIFLPKTKPILIGCIYKPPDQKNFNDLLNRTFSSCVTQETYILVGWFVPVMADSSWPHKYDAIQR